MRPPTRLGSIALSLSSIAALALALAEGCASRTYVREEAAAPTATAGSGVTVVEYGGEAYGSEGYGGERHAGAGYGGEAGSPGAGVELHARGELLSLPVEAERLLHLVRHVVITTDDGRTFQLAPSDIERGMAGRLAVRLPAGVTTGTATAYLNDGQTYSTTFHVAVRSGSVSVGIGGAGAGPVGDPRCALPSGTWQGTISSDPRSSSTVWLEVLADCRTVRGYVHLDSSGGSVDSTIEGTWDLASQTLYARDTQLFNVQPMPGGTFCATDEYRLSVSYDGRSIEGQNITYQDPCRGSSRVWLRRTQ
jgi:hypothetical protein